jgi:hypothetical protein
MRKNSFPTKSQASQKPGPVGFSLLSLRFISATGERLLLQWASLTYKIVNHCPPPIFNIQTRNNLISFPAQHCTTNRLFEIACHCQPKCDN